jgi:uncharacterized protein with PQ loop repeat
MLEWVASLGKKVLTDKLIFVVALLGPATAIPQIVDIWFMDKPDVGVSIISWILFLIFSLVWFWYGLVRNDKAVLLSNGLWVVAECVIILGLFMSS